MQNEKTDNYVKALDSTQLSQIGFELPIQDS